MQIVNVEQGTDEWFKVRELKLTASNAQAISAQGKGLESYVIELVAQHLSSAERELYTNEHIERGKTMEAEARYVYGAMNNYKVDEVGFVVMGDYVGCSPDGLVGDDGLVEIKCKSDVKHVKQILDGEKGIESNYRWQMQMQMLVTGRKWCDFISYNPNFKKKLIVFRVEADEKAQAKLKAGFELGEKMIKELLKKAKEGE